MEQSERAGAGAGGCDGWTAKGRATAGDGAPPHGAPFHKTRAPVHLFTFVVETGALQEETVRPPPPPPPPPPRRRLPAAAASLPGSGTVGEHRAAESRGGNKGTVDTSPRLAAGDADPVCRLSPGAAGGAAEAAEADRSDAQGQAGCGRGAPGCCLLLLSLLSALCCCCSLLSC